ncbi:site-specific integrase [Aliivibrio sifiae]
MADAIRNRDELTKILNWLDARNSKSNNTRIIASYCKFLALTGLRHVDASALTFEELHVNKVLRDSITVVQSKALSHRLTKGQMYQKAKAASEVTIVMTNQLKDVIEELKILQGEQGLLFRSQSRNAKGDAITDRGIRDVLKACALDLELPYNLTVHSFRKGFGTILINELGHSISSARDRLGHSSVAITDHYLARGIKPQHAQEMHI